MNILRCRGPVSISRALKSTQALSSKDIRKVFVKYFEDYDHIHVPSSSVVPSDDPSLLFVNAGMNQFKQLFLGSSSDRFSGIPRIVNYQKCIRAGGKHNDLNDVGKDFHHQTFFEMLGNWSFNNSYNKEAACQLSWYFLTDILKIDASRLYVTYFGGNSEIPADTECKKIWEKIGLPPNRILPFVQENFWEMGALGPCGPCTEIHYDRIDGRENAQDLVNKSPDMVELWNIVFMSHNRTSQVKLDLLPKLHIDTGMGLERLASILQNVKSNYDTDIFQPVFASIKELSNKPYTGTIESPVDEAYRVVADHIRAVCVALSDGVVFGPTERGFIIRKMLRRAIWTAQDKLDIKESLSLLIPSSLEPLIKAYPGMLSTDELQKIVLEEESSFLRTLKKNKKRFDDMLFKTPDGQLFSGEDAWKLHDTFGMTVDVTEDLLGSTGRQLDRSRFDELQTQAKMVSKSVSSFHSYPDNLSSGQYPSHSDSSKYLVGCSNEFPIVQSRILELFSKGRITSQLVGEGAVLLEKCQFYANEGGQKTDLGYLTNSEGKKVFEVLNVQKVKGLTVLEGKTADDQVLDNTTVINQHVDVERRFGLMRAHTGTHLLNWKLQTLNIGSGQRGSSVDVDSFRFDYAAVRKPSKDDLIDIENTIRKVIASQTAVICTEMSLEQIKIIPNLQSSFVEGKDYPEMVRVCHIGRKLDESIAIECCCGTHVNNTFDLMDFVIVSDGSIAKGVRRILAVTGHKAKELRNRPAQPRKQKKKKGS